MRQRMWHIKDNLKLEVDFYSLKDLNTNEKAALLDINNAAAHNSLTFTLITLKHYAIGEKKREYERLKSMKNKFA